MKKGHESAVLVIVSVAAVVAVVGLFWTFSDVIDSPTGFAPGASGSIPLSLSGTVFCPLLENKLEFVREDGSTYGGNVQSDAGYRASVKLISGELTTEFNVFFKNSGAFIQQISVADTGDNKQTVDLVCSVPTPPPSPTPEPSPSPSA